MNRSHSRDLDRKRRLSGVLENLPSNVRKRVELLREVHAQRCEVEAKLKEGIEAIEAKYQKLYQPLYTKRYEIVNGISEDEGNEAAMEKGIPGFWLFVLKNNGDLFDLIRRRDGDALKFLKDIKHSPIDEPRGFKIAFFFGANPYFKNSVLTKTYHMNVGDGAVPERAIGTEIDWYPGKSFTQKILKKKNPNTVPKNEKPMDEPIPCRSFFNFFNPPHFPLYKHESDEGEYDEDRIYEDDINEDDIDEEFQELDDDYKIGSTIRDKIIPNAVSWFTTEMDEDYIGMVDVDEFYYDDEEIVFDY